MGISEAEAREAREVEEEEEEEDVVEVEVEDTLIALARIRDLTTQE